MKKGIVVLLSVLVVLAIVPSCTNYVPLIPGVTFPYPDGSGKNEPVIDNPTAEVTVKEDSMDFMSDFIEKIPNISDNIEESADDYISLGKVSESVSSVYFGNFTSKQLNVDLLNKGYYYRGSTYKVENGELFANKLAMAYAAAAGEKVVVNGETVYDFSGNHSGKEYTGYKGQWAEDANKETCKYTQNGNVFDVTVGDATKPFYSHFGQKNGDIIIASASFNGAAPKLIVGKGSDNLVDGNNVNYFYWDTDNLATEDNLEVVYNAYVFDGTSGSYLGHAEMLFNVEPYRGN